MNRSKYEFDFLNKRDPESWAGYYEGITEDCIPYKKYYEKKPHWIVRLFHLIPPRIHNKWVDLPPSK